MRSTKNKFTTGDMSCETSEEPPKEGNIKIKRSIVQY
jgi:hypothetical protein